MKTDGEMSLDLHTKVMGQNCIRYEKTDSTNIRVKELAYMGAAHGTLVIAEQQTLGRGRLGRSWNSPPGDAVYMSLLLRPKIAPNNASMLTLVMGLAAAQACNELLQQEKHEYLRKPEANGEIPRVQLKWPNDLVMNGKKIAGILTEMECGTDGSWLVIIGIGINVNTRDFPEELPSASSLAKEAGSLFAREKLISLCMERFEQSYEIFLRTEDLQNLKKAYETLLVNRGRIVQVLEPGRENRGTALGINERGELLVKKEDGQIEAVYAGEVSVRGIYGYV